MSIRQPVKVAIPEAAFAGLEVQVRMAPAGVTMCKVTCAELTPTVSPPASWTATTGWALNGTPPVELEGFEMNASWVDGPEVAKLFPTAAVVALNAALAEPSGAMARAAIESTAVAIPVCRQWAGRNLPTDGMDSLWFARDPTVVWGMASGRYSKS